MNDRGLHGERARCGVGPVRAAAELSIPMDAPTDVVRIENVTVRIGTRDVLRDVSWRVGAGEHWAILGRNGSGKTTLLKLIHGEVWSYGGRGRVEVLGQRLGACDLPVLRRSIGWVSAAVQQRLYRRQPVLDIVLSGRFATLGLWDQVSEDDRAAARAALSQVGCGHLEERPYAELSQGEQQRVLIARALVSRPALLMLDEPCAGLDFVAREEVLAAVARLAQDPGGPTILYVTHHPEEILPCFRRVLLIEGGRFVAQGDREDVLTGPVLSAAYGTPIQVDWLAGRPILTPVPSGT